MKNKAMERFNNADYAENSTTNPFKAEPWFAPSAICRVLKYVKEKRREKKIKEEKIIFLHSNNYSLFKKFL